MELDDHGKEIKSLKKKVRILTRKLERSEADRLYLEKANEQRESVLTGLIRKLETSQVTLENRTVELEAALTHLKKLQVQLVESEKMSALGILISGIAHEINNPITFIQSNLEHATDYFQDLLELIQLYESYYPETFMEIEEKKESLDLDFIRQDLIALLNSMKVGSERISEIIVSLRTFSRLDESPLKKVDLQKSIESTLFVLKKHFQTSTHNGSPIQVVRNYANLPLIECFASQINQVFLSILVNAIDAIDARPLSQSTQEGMILISTSFLDSRSIMIEIADNGIGMTPHAKQHVFDPFFTTKEVGKGTGLGMAIAHQIITEKHRGEITCTSELGQGTTFTITLPLQ